MSAGRKLSLASVSEEPAVLRARCTERLLAAYLAEADRDYAEALWGDLLRARGAL